jgi:hypothetical protein
MLTPPPCTVFLASPLLGKIFVSAKKVTTSIPAAILFFSKSIFIMPSMPSSSSTVRSSAEAC